MLAGFAVPRGQKAIRPALPATATLRVPTPPTGPFHDAARLLLRPLGGSDPAAWGDRVRRSCVLTESHSPAQFLKSSSLRRARGSRRRARGSRRVMSGANVFRCSSPRLPLTSGPPRRARLGRRQAAEDRRRSNDWSRSHFLAGPPRPIDLERHLRRDTYSELPCSR